MKKIPLSVFLEFVEIKTKVASVFPMLLGILWTVYHFGYFNLLNTVIFVLAALLFDMCTTAINNTMDYKKALDDDYKSNDNVLGQYQLDYKQCVALILMLLSASVLLSLLLVALTDLLLLPIGIICFIIGICYTFGPMPLSRLPLGEVFSGGTMGFGIFFIASFVQQPALYFNSIINSGAIRIVWHYENTLLAMLMSLPLVCLIANIMLANNLCDLEQDIRNERFTLVYFITKKNGVKLYQMLSVLPWLLWVCYVLSGLLPMYVLLLAIPGIFIHLQSVKRFSQKQVKRETFIESIKSFVLFSSIYCIAIIVSLIMK